MPNVKGKHDGNCKRKYQTCICLTCKNDNDDCCIVGVDKKRIHCPDFQDKPQECTEYEPEEL